jgi:hypothetical protein
MIIGNGWNAKTCNTRSRMNDITTMPGMIPPGSTVAIATTSPDDWIRDIGDKIAILTLKEAKVLLDYLECKDLL